MGVEQRHAAGHHRRDQKGFGATAGRHHFPRRGDDAIVFILAAADGDGGRAQIAERRVQQHRRHPGIVGFGHVPGHGDLAVAIPAGDHLFGAAPGEKVDCQPLIGGPFGEGMKPKMNPVVAPVDRKGGIAGGGESRPEIGEQGIIELGAGPGKKRDRGFRARRFGGPEDAVEIYAAARIEADELGDGFQSQILPPPAAPRRASRTATGR